MSNLNLVLQGVTSDQRCVNFNDVFNGIMEPNGTDILGEMDIFKISYFGFCSSKIEWKENIRKYLSGLRINISREYELCVVTKTYSINQKDYQKKEYHFDKVLGHNIVDHCFKNIPEAFTCEMLCIMMKFSEDLGYSYGKKRRNNSCYVFIRDQMKWHNYFSTLQLKSKKKDLREEMVTKVQVDDYSNQLILNESNMALFAPQTKSIDFSNVIFFRMNKESHPADTGMFIHSEIFQGKDRERVFNYEVTIFHRLDEKEEYKTHKHYIKGIRGEDFLTTFDNKLFFDISTADAVRIDASAVFGTRTVSFILVKM